MGDVHAAERFVGTARANEGDELLPLRVVSEAVRRDDERNRRENEQIDRANIVGVDCVNVLVLVLVARILGEVVRFPSPPPYVPRLPYR